MEILSRLISSLEKVFVDDNVEKFPRLTNLSALKGERIAFQLIYKLCPDTKKGIYRAVLTPKLEGTLAEYCHVRKIGQVPVVMPVRNIDDNYLSSRPGLYPDPLFELTNHGRLSSNNTTITESLWIDLEIPEHIAPGSTVLSVTMTNENGEEVVRESLTVEIINEILPKPSIYYTRWFHTDGLAVYYNVPVWSERHWEIIENFARTAVHTGVNTLLTPLITPSLDGPRMITQLVKIRKVGEKYRFDFRRLDRWIDMCNRIGIQYFEISHLFTQGGARNTPRIVATVDGEEKMIFSYANDSRDPEYKVFLRALIKSFIRHMKQRGDDKRCIFHISDEPPLKHIEYYKEAKATVADLIKGYKHIDALSDIEYYKEGLIECPVPLTPAAMTFINAGVPHLWTYYCTDADSSNVSNAFVSTPSYRTRSLGMQLYKYHIEGFLHWGYNFYNDCGSHTTINPFMDLSCNNWVQAGDPFIVYPAFDGTAIESIRSEVTYHALQDIEAMRLCEKYYSHHQVVAAIEEVLGYELDFFGCVRSAEKITAVRERINQMIQNAIA